MANEWQRFFDGYAPQYQKHSFTHDTEAEVAFVLDVLQPPDGGRILDIGCGTGRHAIALAQRGYRVTGVDISEGMLAQARQAAEAAGVQDRVAWVQADAGAYQAERDTYDAAICLCEGAFSLMGADDSPIHRDVQLLRNVYGALKVGGGLVLTCLNGMRYFRMYSDTDIAEGRFDVLGTVAHSEFSWEDAQGGGKFHARERGYVPSELRLMCEVAGFEVEAIWGGTAGTAKRRTPELDEMELMAVVRKPKA